MPKVLKDFLLRAIIFLVVWKLAYFLFFKPKRIPDLFLTNLTAQTTASFMRVISPGNNWGWYNNRPSNNLDFHRADITYNNRRIIGIADPCNALELYVLYISLLVCLPAGAKRFWIFALLGITLILILNTMRCAVMIWINIYHNSFFDFAHHYLFKLVVYAVIFGLWVLYCKKLKYE